ncbi:heme A synthase [Lysinibacillus sp. PLM2]|nr:heme A synthase [Lysinibacillus sp. PLM2]
MQQRQNKLLKWIAVATTLGMLFILLGGALVTKTDSGLGCGRHWPGCNGELIPTKITTEVLIEFSHRLVTGAVSILVLLLVIMTWRKLGHIREVKFLGVLAIFFLLAQALIGAAQVLWGQGDFILALHFGISLISFAAILLLSMIVFEVDTKFDADKVFIDKKLKWHTVGVTLYSYIVIYTGALVRHTGSSLVCLDWPFCDNSQPFALPDNMYQWVQMGHRIAVLIIFIWIAYITWYAVKHYKDQRVIYWGWIVNFTLVVLQIIAGMLVVLTMLDLFVSLLHSLFITLLFGMFCYMILLIARSNHNEKRNM